MKFFKPANYINKSKTIEICPNQHADLLRFLFAECSLKIKKGFGRSSQVTYLIEFFDIKCFFVILHKVAKFHYQTVFT